MEDLRFQERIGDYTVIKSGNIIVFDNKEIYIDIFDKDDLLKIKIEFSNRGGRIASITKYNTDDCICIRFVNFEKDNSVEGAYNPIEIAEFDDGNVLYFSCVLNTIDSKSGIRTFSYSFLMKMKENHEKE